MLLSLQYATSNDSIKLESDRLLSLAIFCVSFWISPASNNAFGGFDGELFWRHTKELCVGEQPEEMEQSEHG
jgi:hypothetical protein